MGLQMSFGLMREYFSPSTGKNSLSFNPGKASQYLCKLSTFLLEIRRSFVFAATAVLFFFVLFSINDVFVLTVQRFGRSLRPPNI